MNSKFRVLFSVLIIFTILIIGFFQNPVKETKRSLKVGVLQLVSHPALDEIYKGIKENLPESYQITLLNAQGDQSQLAIMSEKLVKENDLVISITTPASLSVASKTKDKPIVFSGVTYPLESGLIESEEKSGNNITGVSDQPPIEVQLKLIKEIQPNVKKLGVLYTISEDNSVRQLEKIKKLSDKYDLEIVSRGVSNNNDLQQIAEELISKVDSLYIPIDNGIASAMPIVTKVADKENKAIYPSSESMLKDGGFMTIGINQYEIGKNTALIVKRVFAGDNPSDIPIYKIDNGDVILNEEKAIKLGIKLPEHIKYRKIN
ncbi:ABC transporter substrate-binding protein [Gemelliphila palaticanis]|uniref:ABC transporter substrate-binding protein n=1 Tax=Gemelliphila palaticanis TaxID=81950 RepID=A0ABX2SYG8_9BACL|nr:ABC transporter substrate-binding protein [Gemella palaticanis]MBF0714931.1 ABC transporter substrate-binding protein [Gemella palaticanis]NYS46861.1 ABC transporter substrate-binding protein [Gemella palaticanis]